MFELNNASFRDPSGSIFWVDGRIYRQVNLSYQDDYNLLMSSGLYGALLKNNRLVEHSEVNSPVLDSANHYKCNQLITLNLLINFFIFIKQ